MLEAEVQDVLQDTDSSRCSWAVGYTAAGKPQYIEYHDKEWGRPSKDDRHLLEMLILEGFQVQLASILVLGA